MSIKLGKDKNWGSRTGGSRKPRSPNDLVGKISSSDLPTEILEAIVAGDNSVVESAKEILRIRNLIAQGSGEAPKAVFNTKLGTLYKGDCIKVLNQMQNESLDCVFADPPFNLAKDYDNGLEDALPDEEYLEWTKAWLDLCVAKLKDGGSLFVYNIPKWSVPIAQHLSKSLSFKHWIAVDLTLSMPIQGRLFPSHYALLYFVKGGKANTFAPHRVPIKTCPKCGKEQNDYGGYKKKMNPLGINLRDVWTDIPPVRHSKFKNRDANELHLKLLNRVIDMSTNEGDLIFDPFGGSGTTYVAAELKGRKWIGSELGPCEPIIERLSHPDDDIQMLNKIESSTNLLFTDEALRLREKSGLPLDAYRIASAQIERALGEKFLNENKQLEFLSPKEFPSKPEANSNSPN